MNDVEIVPAIIEETWAAVERKLSRLEGKTDWIHLDASDGVFTGHKTWNNPADLLTIRTGALLEAHLMIAEPQEKIGEWLKVPVGRVVVHVEALKNDSSAEVIESVKASGRAIVFGLNPDTPLAAVEPYLEKIDGVLLLGVQPGWSGGDFQPGVIEKARVLREQWPDGIIGIDGGVNAERAPELIRAGADRLVASSFVWSFDDPAKGIEELKISANES